MKFVVFSLFTFFLILEKNSFATDENNRQIPLHMRMKMKNVRSTSDFIHTMIQDKPAPGAALQPKERQMYNSDTRQGFNQQGVEIMASMIATPDICEPRPSTVEIPPDSDPRVVYWPTCTKVNRCGGCCGLDLLQCEPTAVETITVQVMKQRISANDSSRYEYLGNVDIALEKHVGCDCHCRIKQTDCNPSTQDYDEDSCSCRCRNSHEATSCPSPKRWEEKYCRCVCPVLINCLDDEYFDFNTCSCVRGTAVVAGGAVPFSPQDLCAQTTCRAGYRATVLNGSCQCRRSR